MNENLDMNPKAWVGLVAYLGVCTLVGAIAMNALNLPYSLSGNSLTLGQMCPIVK